MNKKKLPRVVIVGRANVGKSTLFNRLIEKDKALISKIAGTTRDRNVDRVYWRDQEFELIDTGGLDIDQKKAGLIEKLIVVQAKKAIHEADLILFLIDAKEGVLPTDKNLAKEIIKQQLKNKTLLIGNKADSLKWRQTAGELYQLNLGEPIMISAANSSGVGDLLDQIINRLPKIISATKTDAENEKIIKVAIVGKPNVGKSSLVNSILGEERLIVTDIPHTTREAHDLEFIYQNQKFIIIDTAGLRKKGKINPKSLEKKSVKKSINAISQADVVVLVTEVQKKIDTQDKKITQIILTESKPVMIVANKWDLIPDKDTTTVNQYKKYYQSQFPYLWWAPLIFTSAKESQRTKKILDLIIIIDRAKRTIISESQLDKFLKSKIKQHRPTRGRGLKNPYLYKIEQITTNPPRFFIYVNDPGILHFSYLRFIQNHLRDKFNLIGTPIQIEVKKWRENKTKL